MFPVIYIGVGLCMFLLPPVPGVPVYLTGGILLSGMAERNFRPDMCLIPDAAPLPAAVLAGVAISIQVDDFLYQK